MNEIRIVVMTSLTAALLVPSAGALAEGQTTLASTMDVYVYPAERLVELVQPLSRDLFRLSGLPLRLLGGLLLIARAWGRVAISPAAAPYAAPFSASSSAISPMIVPAAAPPSAPETFGLASPFEASLHFLTLAGGDLRAGLYAVSRRNTQHEERLQ